MNPLDVNVGAANLLFNSLYEHPEPAQLMQDLLAIELPDGRCIDVGWSPQFDPTGRYKISILSDDGSIAEAVSETRDAHAVVEIVEELVRLRSARPERTPA
jgi:hypothetical protein